MGAVTRFLAFAPYSLDLWRLRHPAGLVAGVLSRGVMRVASLIDSAPGSNDSRGTERCTHPRHHPDVLASCDCALWSRPTNPASVASPCSLLRSSNRSKD
jgi:hypothetical protein